MQVEKILTAASNVSSIEDPAFYLAGQPDMKLTLAQNAPPTTERVEKMCDVFPMSDWLAIVDATIVILPLQSFPNSRREQPTLTR